MTSCSGISPLDRYDSGWKPWAERSLRLASPTTAGMWGSGFTTRVPSKSCAQRNLGALTQTFTIRNAQEDWHLASSSLSPDQARFDRARLVHGPYRIQGPQLDLEDVKDVERMRQEDKLPILRLYKDDQVIGSTMSFTGFKAYTFTADGRYVAAADFAGVIHVFRVPDMQQVAYFPATMAPIDALAVSSDSRYLFSGGSDQTLRIWNLADLPPVDVNRVDEEAVERMRKLLAMAGEGGNP